MIQTNHERMIVTRLIPEARTLQTVLRRNYGVSAVLLQKAGDPIQQLFVDKIREYGKKKSAAGGKLVDSNPQIEKEMQQELDKVARQYGGGPGVDMTKFPAFEFTDPKINPL
ncbi:ATP synthase-coupling factor 6, mitochondrial isoform X1 [Macrobrachium rosenbergii]|uniref:ATP synthase-coupling factor 6, mitochondrial isoform X1 n=2 Tax=Macrobrachium rosenbergii TaxID=79674 RepID=UPI0034D3BF8E